jgi:uncharacterized protein YydD (DUF2326 family)
MGIRSAVLEISEDGRRTERNVVRKTSIFVNFDYEVLKIITKNLYCCFCLLANRNIASKVQSQTPTVLTYNTFTVFTHIHYMHPHYTYSEFTYS